MSTDELEEALSKSLLAGIRKDVMNSPEILARQQEIDEINADRHRMAQENQLSLIFRTPINGKVAIDNQASRSIIRSWVDETKGEAITPAWFVQILKENPSLGQSLAWQSADILDPVKRHQAESAQAAQDRDTFNRYARESGFSECESNYLLAKSVLGDHLARHLLVGAVESNALSLAPASPEELAIFRQDAIAAHNQKLLSMDVPTLRKLARQAGARGPAPVAPDETQRVRAVENQDRTYPLLPDELRIGDREELIDSAYIRRCSKEVLRSLIHKYGAPQIDEALRTRSPQTSPLW
jgi:hypothetical protein